MTPKSPTNRSELIKAMRDAEALLRNVGGRWDLLPTALRFLLLRMASRLERLTREE